ncbi:MAG: hypothetical protein H0X29_08760 [Parachlamydiaceae bacterium]|nr:hypothetical protein [Parachlamydiaceae bacterium]
MFKWFEQYQAASKQTKYFILNWIIYGLAIIITTVYCYGRLDFVRSYKTPLTEMHHPQK